MTIPGLKSLRAELEGLDLPPYPTPEDLEAQRFMASLTPEEIDKAGEILIDASPTPEDMVFMADLAAREPADLPRVDSSQPVCHICGQQPAYPRDGSWSICEACYSAMLGNAYES